MLDRLAASGFAICEHVLAVSQVDELAQYVGEQLLPGNGRGGVRNLLADASMRDVATSPLVRALVTPILGDSSFAVRGILFDKTPDANWKVPWHQDVTIAVKTRMDVPSFGPWSIKDGVQHVQPPAAVLERMLSVRIHLDPCPVDNGALRVLPGTHLLGKLTEREIAHHAACCSHEICEVGRGGVLLMHPLLVHASSASSRVDHRRVLHFDFAADPLPGGLSWAEQY